MKRFSILVFGLLIIAVGMLSACGESSNTGANSTPSASQQTAQHFKVADTVKVGSTWQVVVNSIATNTGDQFNVPKNGTYIVVNISLTNTSQAEQNLSSLLSFKFKDTDGTAYNEAITGGLASISPSPNGKVAAGDVIKGDLVYDVPVDKKTFTLSFAPDLTSSGQTIWDLALP